MNFMLFSFFQENYLELHMILWYITNIILFASFFLFLIEALKIEAKSQKRVYVGYSLFSLFFGFTRLFFLLSWIYDPVYQDFFLILGYLIGTMGVIIIIFIMETYLLKTKKILTTITIILFCLILIALFGFTSREEALFMIYILLPAVILAIAISYIYLIIKSTGSSRKKAIGALTGIALIFIGHLMNTHFFNSLFPGSPIFISPIIMSIGITVFTITQIYIK